MKAMTTTSADVEIRSRMPSAAGPAVFAMSECLLLMMSSSGAIGLGMQDGTRTDGTGKGRETPVTNGHSRSETDTETAADQRRNAQTRAGDVWCKVVRFPQLHEKCHLPG